MARYGRVAGWAILAIALLGVAAYLALVLTGDVRPPIVPVGSDARVPGLATGDAVIVEKQPETLRIGDVMVVDIDGDVVVGRLAQTSAGEDGPVHLLEGTGMGGEPVVEVPVSDVIGVGGRTVAFLGWPLLAAREPAGQLGLVVAFVGLAFLLLARDRRPATALGLPAFAPIALPAGPPVVTNPAAMKTIDETGAETIIDTSTRWPYGGPPVALTPEDIRNVHFLQTRKGYDTEAVDHALDVVADSIETLLRDRQRLVERLRSAEADLERYRDLASRQIDQQTATENGAIDGGSTEVGATDTGVNDTGANDAVVNDAAALVILLGETRAMRSLLHALVAERLELEAPAPS